METAKIIKVRTLNGCVLELKKLDPDTQVSKNYIRNLVLSGRVRSTKAGVKYLVNFESLLKYFETPIEQETDAIECGTLRKVKT